MLLLDTDHVSLLQWGTGADAIRLRSRLQAVVTDQVATTIISFEEQSRGWLAYVARAKSLVQQVDAYQRLRRHLDLYRAITVVDFDQRAAATFRQLQQQVRNRMGTMDLKIAAIAITFNATLLTRNTVDFSRIPALRIDDWTK